MRITIGLVALSIFGIGYSAEAMAQAPPPACRSEPNRSSFHAGVASGRALTRQAWVGVNRNCFRLEEYTTVVVGTVKRLIAPAGSDSYVLCRHAGIVAGVLDEVDVVWDECQVTCCNRGYLTGEMAGELYCGLAIALDGLGVADYLPQLPVTFCPAVFETCCKTRFIGYTENFINAQGAACRPYTRPPHTAAWDQARENMCIAEEPPPRP